MRLVSSKPDKGGPQLISDLEIDQMLRLLAATAAGIALGFNRELRNKPLGMRTLALVGLGSAIAVLAAVHFRDLDESPEALSRVVQGSLQGVLTGIGFIGAGVVLHDTKRAKIHGLTTAATVWITATLAVACALAAWSLVLTGLLLALLLLFGLGWLEKKYFPGS